MPLITFTQDVTPDGAQSAHYKKGYCCDVSVDVARDWVTKGVAKYGRIEFAASKQEKPVTADADAAEETRTAKTRSRSRKSG